ncbi:MAG: prolyl aminopeptidase [Pseudonocardiaceae bacterium]
METALMAERYPVVEPYDSGTLDVTDGHRLYWEMCGAPDGTPAVYLHGGPGSGCTHRARRSFDPRSYRLCCSTSAGAGAAGLWPATLTPTCRRTRRRTWSRTSSGCIVMALCAVTTGTRRETDWITRDMGRVFPRESEQFASAVPAAGRDSDLPGAYARLLADPDPQLRARAAQQWCTWEDTHMSLAPGWAPNLSYRDPEFQLTFARLVTHYWSQGCFLTEGEILANMHRLADIPAVLIHGRYDVSGPLDTAWHLHRA